MTKLLELSRGVLPYSAALHYRSLNLFSNHGFAIGSVSRVLDSKTSQNPNSGEQFRPFSSASQISGSNHSAYMNQLFPKSNSSFKLSSGNSLHADVVRLSEDVFCVDSGIGTPRICLQDELTGVKDKSKIRFENQVGFLDLVTSETLISKMMLERFFIDLVAGDSMAKERATARFNDMVGGSADMDAVAAGEPLLVLPRRYRQKRAWMELSKKWRSNSQVKGFIVGKMRGGYSVAIAGFVAFLPYRHPNAARRLTSDRFTIETINLKSGNIVVV